MTPIEGEIKNGVVADVRRGVEDTDRQINRTQFLLLRDFFTLHLVPALLKARYAGFQVKPKDKIQALMVKGQLFTLENITMSSNEEPAPHLVLLDGLVHRVVIDPRYLGVAAWSYPDKEDRQYPFSHELETVPLGDYLHFDRVKESNGHVWQPLLGPEGVNLSSSLINNVAYWEITPQMLYTPPHSNGHPRPSISERLVSFRDSLLSTYDI